MFKSVILKKVEFASAVSLSSMEIVAPAKCKFKSEPSFTEININELADVKIEDSLENNQKIFTSILSFKTCARDPLADRRLVYRLTAADGTQYILGSKSRPFPITTEENPFPSNPTESSLKKVTVKWQSIFPLLTVE